MSRSKEVSLIKRYKTWEVRFYKNDNGKRIKKSTKTHIEEEALTIKKQIELLQINPDAIVDSVAYEIFFGTAPIIKNKDAAKLLFKRFDDEEDDAYIIASLANELEIKNRLVFELQEKVRRLELDKEALLQDTLTYRLNQAKTCPSLSEAIQTFYLKEISGLSKNNFREHQRVINEFIEGRTQSKVSLISDSAINDYLEESVDDHENPNYRYNYNRTYIGRFFNWASAKYKFLNPMISISKKPSEQKEDLHWHDLDYVLEVIENEQEQYWKNVLATFLYSGLSSHELRGLRKIDVIETTITENGKNKRVKFLYVTPHKDRTLKTLKRKRHVMVCDSLEPYIASQIQTAGKYLFPPTVGHREIWHPDTFSDHLNWRTRDDMTALSLRRTFGSLMLRAGYSPYLVSQLMGNSEEIVKRHYARILAKEINTNINNKLSVIL